MVLEKPVLLRQKLIDCIAIPIPVLLTQYGRGISTNPRHFTSVTQETAMVL